MARYTEQAKGGSSVTGRSTIPNADDVRFLGAGPDARGGFTFSFADGEENGVIRILAEHLYEMMGGGTERELNCVQFEIIPHGLERSYTLTLQRENGKTPLRLKAEAVTLLKRALPGLRTDGDSDLAEEVEAWLAADLADAPKDSHPSEEP